MTCSQLHHIFAGVVWKPLQNEKTHIFVFRSDAAVRRNIVDDVLERRAKRDNHRFVQESLHFLSLSRFDRCAPSCSSARRRTYN